MIKLADKWKDYEVIATTRGEKLERWGDMYLIRPDPQVIWDTGKELTKLAPVSARYQRSQSGGGEWRHFDNRRDEFRIGYGELVFNLKLMGFKHTGVFPEQAANWDTFGELIKNSNRRIRVLNLFAYTGGATLAAAKAGAEVCQVDASKGMTQRAKDNARSSGLSSAPIRYIVDDCKKFVEREIKRGSFYEGVIMDPPSYGRGPDGEMWKLEDNLFSLVQTVKKVLSEKPLFFLINSYTTGLAPSVLQNILTLTLKEFNGISDCYELALPTKEGIILPCGASGLWRTK